MQIAISRLQLYNTTQRRLNSLCCCLDLLLCFTKAPREMGLRLPHKMAIYSATLDVLQKAPNSVDRHAANPIETTSP